MTHGKWVCIKCTDSEIPRTIAWLRGMWHNFDFHGVMFGEKATSWCMGASDAHFGPIFHWRRQQQQKKYGANKSRTWLVMFSLRYKAAHEIRMYTSANQCKFNTNYTKRREWRPAMVYECTWPRTQRTQYKNVRVLENGRNVLRAIIHSSSSSSNVCTVRGILDN